MVADLTPSTFCDSAGVQEMLRAHRVAAVEGIELGCGAFPADAAVQPDWA